VEYAERMQKIGKIEALAFAALKEFTDISADERRASE